MIASEACFPLFFFRFTYIYLPMVTRTQSLLSWLAIPVYVWQGLGVRRRTVRMSPPPAPSVLEIKGKGKPINVLILGDSSAAGVGVDTIEQSLGGHLLRLLSEKTGRPVSIRICGNNSATSAQIRDHVLPNLEPVEYDFISLNIGTNDAKNFHRGSRFCKDFGGLIYALRARFPETKIIWGGVIDLAKAPTLPSPLNWILGVRSRIIDGNGRILCEERGVLAPLSKWQAIKENFSKDGFHASSLGYERWADELAEYIVELENNKKT